MGFRARDCESESITIFLAGDIDLIKKAAHRYCTDSSFCVTVTATEYIYRYGRELGALVGIINYPRFPISSDELISHAEKLARALAIASNQGSYTIQTQNKTIFYSRRED